MPEIDLDPQASTSFEEAPQYQKSQPTDQRVTEKPQRSFVKIGTFSALVFLLSFIVGCEASGYKDHFKPPDELFHVSFFFFEGFNRGGKNQII